MASREVDHKQLANAMLEIIVEEYAKPADDRVYHNIDHLADITGSDDDDYEIAVEGNIDLLALADQALARIIAQAEDKSETEQPNENLRRGDEYPYDAGEEFWRSNNKAPRPTDWAHRAARGILWDLNDRKGIRQELGNIDHQTRSELTQTMAKIIRDAYKEG